MSYQPLARKYRPSRFAELVGQDAVSLALSNAIASGRVLPNLIFTGVRGVGKTTVARLYAKALNCERVRGRAVGERSVEPCNECESCVAIAGGRHEDVLEIDGASNTSVNDVRALQETIDYAPQRSPFKVYIIDEVHMLSTAAFNALLKTLEERRAHVIFVFATTELHRVPETILSRCPTFHLKKLTVPVVAQRLAEILTAEKLPFEDKALTLIAREGHGSMRDALTLLDQAIALGDGNVTLAALGAIVSNLSSSPYLDLLDALVARAPAAAMDALEALDQGGADFAGVVEETAKLARHGFVVRDLGPQALDTALLGLDDAELGRLGAIARVAGPFDLNRIFRTLVKCRQELDGSALDRFVVENHCFEWCLDPGLPDVDALLAGGGGRGTQSGVRTPAGAPRGAAGASGVGFSSEGASSTVGAGAGSANGMMPAPRAAALSAPMIDAPSAVVAEAPAAKVSPSRMRDVMSEIREQAKTGGAGASSLGKPQPSGAQGLSVEQSFEVRDASKGLGNAVRAEGPNETSPNGRAEVAASSSASLPSGPMQGTSASVGTSSSAVAPNPVPQPGIQRSGAVTASALRAAVASAPRDAALAAAAATDAAAARAGATATDGAESRSKAGPSTDAKTRDPAPNPAARVGGGGVLSRPLTAPSAIAELAAPATPTVSPAQTLTPMPHTPGVFPANWRALVDAWRRQKPLQARKIEETHPLVYTPERIVLAVSEDAYVSRSLLSVEEQGRIREQFRELFGFSGTLQVVSKSDAVRDRALAEDPPPPDDSWAPLQSSSFAPPPFDDPGSDVAPSFGSEQRESAPKPLLPDTVLDERARETLARREALMEAARSAPFTKEVLAVFGGTIEDVRVP